MLVQLRWMDPFHTCLVLLLLRMLERPVQMSAWGGAVPSVKRVCAQYASVDHFNKPFRCEEPFMALLVASAQCLSVPWLRQIMLYHSCKLQLQHLLFNMSCV